MRYTTNLFEKCATYNNRSSKALLVSSHDGTHIDEQRVSIELFFMIVINLL